MPHRIIGIICSSEGWGGLELNTLRLSKWLRQSGWKVHLLASGGAPITSDNASSCNSISTFAQNGKPPRSAQLRVVHDWIRRYKIRLVFVTFNKDIAVASLYKRFYNSNMLVVYQQHMQVGVRKRDLIHTLRYAMIDAWISPLQYLKEETLRLIRIAERKVHVIPFGVEAGKFVHTNWTREAARDALGLPANACFIGLLGRLDPGKGQDVAIRAMHYLLASNRNCELLIMGSATRNEAGEHFEQSLHWLAAETGVAQSVHFRPFSEDVMCFFRAINMFAMPAPGETFGMVTVEAMMAGVPVVGANKDGTREILEGGRFGWLFEPGDENDLCRVVSGMLASGELSQKANTAQQEALARYSHQNTVSVLADLMERLITTQEKDQ